ncbi:MAG: cupin domain-containing protein [Anaerolineaceae bacterium]|jgi:ethanolamine utilization protein EutQ
MPRQFFTADDVYRLAREQGSAALVLGTEDVITPEAEEQAERLGLSVVRKTRANQPIKSATEHKAGPRALPPLKVVRGAGVELQAFGDEPAAKAANVRLKDVVTSADGAPVAAGYMALDRGGFAWTLNYDEIDIVLEGELVIRRGAEEVSGGPGDVIYIPQGSSIEFTTPSHVRFVYVTYPADWQ